MAYRDPKTGRFAAAPPGQLAEYDLDTGTGITRTDMYCSECGKQFIAEIDHAIEGDFVIECPSCLHEHLRKISQGTVTASRWGSRNRPRDLRRVNVWKSSVIQAKTSSAAMFLRDKWLNLGV